MLIYISIYLKNQNKSVKLKNIIYYYFIHGRRNSINSGIEHLHLHL